MVKYFSLFAGLLMLVNCTRVNESPVLHLEIDPSQPGTQIAEDFIGLGYEKTILTKEGIFVPENTVLTTLLRNLGKGNLRIGANGADISGWTRERRSGSTPENTVTSDDIDNFYSFVEGTGWNVVHALNLRNSKPEIGADEAEYASSVAKNNLIAFEIGNEPDLKMRTWYKVSDYIKEFRSYTTAIRAKVPNARFVGPGATYFSGQQFWSLSRGVDEWAVPFAREAGDEIIQLTHHIYVLGQPYATYPEENYLATIPNLLSSPAKERYIPTLKKLSRAAAEQGISYRINESNSCYHGGKDSVSNVFASALWVADYLFTLAYHGASGVNFHGGTQHYAPVETLDKDLSTARPMYYGLLMFHNCSNGSPIPVNLIEGPDLEVSRYAVLANDGSLAVSIINRETDRDITIALDVTKYFTKARILRLEGPSLDSKTGVTFGGASVAKDGSWSPVTNEECIRKDRLFRINVPASSAVAMLFDKDPLDPVKTKRPGR